MSVIDRAQNWRDYAERGDGLEVAPCVWVGDQLERIDTGVGAAFWAVYVHLPEGGVEWIADYDNRVSAVLFAEGAVEDHPNLDVFGIIKCWN